MSVSYELKGPRFELDIASEAYPEILRDIPEPPSVLYGIGNPEALQPGVAVIGSRKATPYGLSCAKMFSEHIASRGITLVSGGAIGCDQCAHRAAVENNTPTIVVFGSSPDITYPKRGRALFQSVIDQDGVIISEQVWGTPPIPGTFVARNRIIAGLAFLVLIAEAGMPSGTFSTADAALKSNRDVAAVPGSISSPISKGTNHLISQGAYAVIDNDTLDSAIDLAWTHSTYTMFSESAGNNPKQNLQALIGDDPMLAALAAEPLSVHELAAYFDFSLSELSSRLSQYELASLIERGRDGRYQFCPR